VYSKSAHLHIKNSHINKEIFKDRAMDFFSKLSANGLRFLFLIICGYLAYHCSMPATDILSRRIMRRVLKDIRAFDAGDQSTTNVSMLRGGLSGTRLYKVTLDKMSYVVRQIAGRSKYDTEREMAAQQRASDGGWGPHVYYVDQAEGIIMMEFLNPDQKYLADATQLNTYEMLGQLLKKIHAAPGFDTYHASILDEIATQINQLSSAGTDGHFTARLQKQLLEILDKSREAQRQFPTSTFTHRDLNPNNIIMSGGALFVIDFENAAQDDPYFDLATVGIFNLFTTEQEDLFFASYFDRPATLQEYEKYQDMKIAAYLFYGLSLIEKTPASRIDSVDDAEPFIDVYMKIGQGVYDLSEAAHRRVFGLGLVRQAVEIWRERRRT
jgi:tRNA A-37 threonylcarbamoyl transferase component Bud32